MRLARPTFVRTLLITQILSLVVICILAVTNNRSNHNQDGNYPLLAKRLFLNHPNDIIINFTPLREQLEAFTKDQKEQIGIYFEYLPTGTSININGKEEFYRASLVKLPVVMRAYKYIEDGKLSLDDVLTIEQKQLNSEYGDLWKAGVGTKISVRDVIQAILVKSDNTAFNVLYEKVNVQLRNDLPSGDLSADDVYDYLDIPHNTGAISPMITPKNFTSILKSLYFSSYLSYTHSNEILSSLTQPRNEDWIRSAIPSTIKVADKIGVYTAEPATQHVYADCGIIYYPERSYSLCVMVRSDNAATAIPQIHDISKKVYEYIQQPSSL